MRQSRKNSLFVVLLISLCCSSLVLMTSCKDSRDLTEPQVEAKLVVDDGYYSKVETTNSGENIYSVVIQYHVEGSDFIIGNYDIQWKSENIGKQVFLNSMVVNPDKTLKIEETFTFPREVLESPIITIAGYALNQKGDGETSEVSYTIQKK
jgi:hypothetical protein